MNWSPPTKSVVQRRQSAAFGAAFTALLSGMVWSDVHDTPAARPTLIIAALSTCVSAVAFTGNEFLPRRVATRMLWLYVPVMLLLLVAAVFEGIGARTPLGVVAGGGIAGVTVSHVARLFWPEVEVSAQE